MLSPKDELFVPSSHRSGIVQGGPGLERQPALAAGILMLLRIVLRPKVLSDAFWFWNHIPASPSNGDIVGWQATSFGEFLRNSHDVLVVSAAQSPVAGY